MDDATCCFDISPHGLRMCYQTFNSTNIILWEYIQTLIAYACFIHHVAWIIKLTKSRVPLHLLNCKVLQLTLMHWVRCWRCQMFLTVQQMWWRRAELSAALKIQLRYCTSVRVVYMSWCQACLCCVHLRWHMAYVKHLKQLIKTALPSPNNHSKVICFQI